MSKQYQCNDCNVEHTIYQILDKDKKFQLIKFCPVCGNSNIELLVHSAITYKQTRTINNIQRNLGITFYGTTRKEASLFIEHHLLNSKVAKRDRNTKKEYLDDIDKYVDYILE